MSVENVKKYLAQYSLDNRVKEFELSSATVELAAKAVGTQGCRIAKTLSFKEGDGCILVVTAGDMKIDNSKFKAQFGMKAKMLDFEEIEPLTGHKAGGVCPFANPDGVKVYLDVSLKRFETVFPAAGSSNSALELTIEELERASRAIEIVDVCKTIEA